MVFLSLENSLELDTKHTVKDDRIEIVDPKENVDRALKVNGSQLWARFNSTYVHIEYQTNLENNNNLSEGRLPSIHADRSHCSGHVVQQR